MRHIAALLAVVMGMATAMWAAEEQVYRTDHVSVSYTGIEEAHAQAIARIVEAARKAAVELFGFDMPDSIAVSVDCRPGNVVRLFNDGQDRLSLSVRSKVDLNRPAKSGIFHVYGLCHEVGHLAMYRVIRQHDWLTEAGAEGWAHYIGSRLVDAVYAAEGEKAWCDPYDYRADGTRRLEAQLKQAKRTPIAEGAFLWQQLAQAAGDKQLSPVLKAWSQAKVEAEDPGQALRAALLEPGNDQRLATWWNKAEPVLVFKRPRSGFVAKTVPLGELSNQPKELARDDGKPAGKSSIAGGGHGVVFEAPGESWYLTSVRIYGSRYGMPQAPNEDFRVWLCDEEGKAVRELKFPYRLFQRGQPAWVKLQVQPTLVPRRFMICVGFNPTGTKGVFVHYDAAADGQSRTGLPGEGMEQFQRGDWMIRATVDQTKSADPLKERN